MSTLPQSDHAKQPPSVYTVMLVLSMVFLLIAVIAMFIELRRWGPDYWRTNQARPMVQLVAPAAPAADYA